MAIERDRFDEVRPGQASAPDLDAWRAEAGDALEVAGKATPGPWLTLEEAPRWDTPNAVGYDSREHHRGPPYYATGVRVETVEQAETDAAFIAAARTGWPRDAARVAVLCAEVERLTVALDAPIGCADHSCVVSPTVPGKPSGMRTNGHCRCDEQTLRRAVRKMRAEVERLTALEAVAINHHDKCLGACGCSVCAWVKASRKAGGQ